ncbi:hypothetical protein QBC40DRAFT_278106 [Triangularia verruculosa]|uniref:Uncharacterized protein n=1 Tax=Triangularia verruculosa TaxID=2587418 RepID=A0AAN7AX05_9PEZI|nr:hypothetical protein QBC40DRAFT_278106 [Triangularia verruculosa]
MSKNVLPIPPPPPLLLTKRVTAFLRANLSPSLQAAMLTTPAGNLLAHASSLPASALRRQCAVAASIWALQSQSSPPPSEHKTKRHKSTPALTVQLDSGLVFVIRRLKCGMLFVCMGGSGGQSPSSPPQQQQQQQQNPSISAALSSPQPTPTAEHSDQQQDGLLHPGSGAQGDEGTTTTTTPIGSPSANSEVGRASVMSAGTTSGQTITSQTSTSTTTTSSAGVVLMRRQVEELARWLDDKLGGLCVPEEGIGIDNLGYQFQQQLEIR